MILSLFPKETDTLQNVGDIINPTLCYFELFCSVIQIQLIVR